MNLCHNDIIYDIEIYVRHSSGFRPYGPSKVCWGLRDVWVRIALNKSFLTTIIDTVSIIIVKNY